MSLRTSEARRAGVASTRSKAQCAATEHRASVSAGRCEEHATLTEGSVTYDIRFYAQAPRDGTLMEIIVNVEAQNKYNPGYPLIKRGIYYVSRMISAQNGVDFKNGEYGKLKKVCSIWICLNAPKERRNSITRYTLREEQLVGNSVEAAKNYDLISVVMICLGDAQEHLTVQGGLDLGDRFAAGKKVGGKHSGGDEVAARLMEDEVVQVTGALLH